MTNNTSNLRSDSPEYGVDSRYKSLDKKLSEGKRLLQSRLARLNELSRTEIIGARLLQLKLRMEDYLLRIGDESRDLFTSFLKDYIDTIYDRRTSFAKDINISAVSLSQIINNHREPKEEFMYRLMIHSELTFKNIASFENSIWYKVFYHGKMCTTMANQSDWKKIERKNVDIRGAALN